MTARADDLAGPFAASPGAPTATARVALIAGAAALSLAGLRPLFDVMGQGDTRWITRAAFPLAILGVVLGLAGLYLVAARALGGRRLASLGVALAAAGGLLAFLYAAIEDGSLRPGRFIEAYFDMEILRALPGDLRRGAVNTVKLAFVAEALAVLVGLVVATLALSARRSMHYPAVAYVDLVRGLPLVMLTLLINDGLTYIGLTLGQFAAVVSILTINASAYIAEIFRAGIQSLPRGQLDAARSLGMPYGTSMLFVVIPQAVRAVIPPLMNEFIALVKDTAIVIALVGFTTATRDLYGAASQGAASTFSPTPLMAASIVYLMITVPMTRLVGIVERRLRRGLA